MRDLSWGKVTDVYARCTHTKIRLIPNHTLGINVLYFCHLLSRVSLFSPCVRVTTPGRIRTTQVRSFFGIVYEIRTEPLRSSAWHVNLYQQITIMAANYILHS